MATTTVAPPRVATTSRSRARQEATSGLLFALPATVFVLVLFVVPLGLAAWMSLNDWPLIGSPTFNAPDQLRRDRATTTSSSGRCGSP